MISLQLSSGWLTNYSLRKLRISVTGLGPQKPCWHPQDLHSFHNSFVPLLTLLFQTLLSVCICVCVCVRACMRVHEHVCACAHVCVCVCACMHTCTHAHACVCACICVCMCLWMCVHVSGREEGEVVNQKGVCALAVGQYLPHMTMNCLSISSSQCLLTFSCHCEVCRAHLEAFDKYSLLLLLDICTLQFNSYCY